MAMPAMILNGTYLVPLVPGLSGAAIAVVAWAVKKPRRAKLASHGWQGQ